MTLFWIICAALLVVAILFVAVPLWRGTSKNNSVMRDAANLEILRDQIAEMDADLKNGLLTPELHEQGKRELQARLLEEVGEASGGATSNQPHPLRITAIALALLLPLASIGLYLKVGNLNSFEPQSAHGMGGMVHTETGLKDLEDRVAKNPDDPNALVMLARSYMEVERYVDAVKTYEQLMKLVPNEAGLWADYADAMAMAHGSLIGPATKLLEQALAINPDEPKALALSGTAAMERGDYPTAIGYWQKLLKLMPAGTPDAKMVEDGIQEARRMMGMAKSGKAAPMLEQINQPPKAQAGGRERISGTVILSDALKSKADPNDTVFVVARAAQGPRMPLAILRKQVKDLPLSFNLDDSMAMSPEMKMSNFDQIVVVARISKSGNAMPQPGDLEGMSKPLALGSTGIKVYIDKPVR